MELGLGIILKHTQIHKDNRGLDFQETKNTLKMMLSLDLSDSKQVLWFWEYLENDEPEDQEKTRLSSGTLPTNSGC